MTYDILFEKNYDAECPKILTVTATRWREVLGKFSTFFVGCTLLKLMDTSLKNQNPLFPIFKSLYKLAQ